MTNKKNDEVVEVDCEKGEKPENVVVHVHKQSVFFWGSGEANSQTNSPQEADDRPKSLQSVNSVALMVCRLYGLQAT